MYYNLTDVFSTIGKAIDETIPYEQECVVNRDKQYQITVDEPFQFHFKNLEKGKVRISGSGHYELLLPCDRCLRETKQRQQLQFEYEVYAPEREMTKEQREEQSFLEDYKLNVDELINDEILMSWPMKILCREDCRGLCPVCGKNRNDGDCGCDDFVPDPRMAKIKDIFDANKEV